MINNHNNNDIFSMKKTSILYQIILVLISANPSPFIVEALPNVIELSAGMHHACALIDSNMMKCWGMKYSFGTSTSTGDGLGNALNELEDNIPYVNVSISNNIIGVTCGGQHTCVRIDTNQIKCIGSNQYGQVGMGLPATTTPIGSVNGYIADILTPVDVGFGIQVLEMALGRAHTCLRVSGNQVKCFGFNDFGELGHESIITKGTYTSDMGDNLVFVDLGTGVDVASVKSSPNADHSCVIISSPPESSQRVKCWGYNNYYQLGYGSPNSNIGDEPGEMGDNLDLVDFGSESRVKQISLGARYTCALLLTDILKCSGDGSYGQLGSGSTATISSTGNEMPAVLIDAGRTISYLSTGAFHTCIVYAGYPLMKCFGQNMHGQLGYGDIINRGLTPTTVIPYNSFIDLYTSVQIRSVHSGYSFNCILFVDSKFKCFGLNQYGELAIGSYNTIGDNPGEMGPNLQYAKVFAPVTVSPTASPTRHPTEHPTVPTNRPTRHPTFPTSNPTTARPTTKAPAVPTKSPLIITKSPATITNSPSKEPTAPITFPTRSPNIIAPTLSPSFAPTYDPTFYQEYGSPAYEPSGYEPSGYEPTGYESSGYEPTYQPSNMPTKQPIIPQPTSSPTFVPTDQPTLPTASPTRVPTTKPTVPTKSPFQLPTSTPTSSGSLPTKKPTVPQSSNPTHGPTQPTISPSFEPTSIPTLLPTTIQTTVPTHSPTKQPTNIQTVQPTISPTKKPVKAPTHSPTRVVSNYPTIFPTSSPTIVCNHDDKWSCKKDIGCIWINDKDDSTCIPMFCFSYKSELSCESDSRCQWKKFYCVNKKWHV